MATTKITKGIQNVLVQSIPKNTYNTYALALAALATTFNELTDDEKINSVLILGNSIFSPISKTGFASVGIATGGGEVVFAGIDNINLSSKTYKRLSVRSDNTNTVVDYSEQSQSQALALYIRTT